jgi:ribose transport system substrate-binding protein
MKRHRTTRTAVWLIASVLLATLPLTGNGASAHRLHASPHRKQAVFYLIPGLSNDAFYTTMQQGARAAAKRLGVRLVYQGSPYAFTPAAQIPYLDAAIAHHPSAILIAPTDRTALIGPIRRAVRAGVPVIAVDTFISAPLAVTNVRSPNAQGGRLAAIALARAIHFHGTVAGISVRPGISSTDRRQQGFAQQLRTYPQIHYLGAQYDGNNLSRAARITTRLLAHHPHLNGIFAMNGLSGDGVITVLQETHRTHQVKLVEFDADPIQAQALRQGIVQALIAQDPRSIGALAVRLADRWVTGHRHGIRKLYYTREIILTPSNINNLALKRFLYSSG